MQISADLLEAWYLKWRYRLGGFVEEFEEFEPRWFLSPAGVTYFKCHGNGAVVLAYNAGPVL